MSDPVDGGGGRGGAEGGNARSVSFLASFCLVLLFFTLADVGPFGSSGSSVASAASDSGPKDIPAPKLASMMAGPSIKFLYW